MKFPLLSFLCCSALMVATPLLTLSTAMAQEGSQAIAPVDSVLGEDPARRELAPPTDLRVFEAFAVANDYKLRIVYMIPSNRSPQPQAEAILQEYVLRMQNWSSDHMERLGYGAKTFKYETEADGITPLVNLAFVAGVDTDFHGTYLERWSKILGGIASAGFPPWQEGELLLVVAETHVQLTDGSILEGSTFFGGAGTNYSGVGMVTGETLARSSEAFLVDDRPYDGLIIPEIGPYPLEVNVTFPWFEGSTVSSTSSSAQGGAFHEVAHGLGLGHDFRNDMNFNGNLLGNGLRGIRGALFPDLYPNDDTRLSSASALQLNYNRFFNHQQVFSEDIPPQVEILTSGTVVPINGQCQLDFTASDVDSGLAGAILFRNGSVAADMPLTGHQVFTSIASYDYEPGVAADWDIQVFDTQGNRMSSRANVACAAGFNQAPKPFIRLNRTIINQGEEIILDAQLSSDPDGDQSLLSVEWDLDGDGNFDTPPSTAKTHSTRYETPGVYQIIARLTDEQGDASQSMPIGIRVEQAISVDNINDLVTFEPDPSTFSTTSDTTGCHEGFLGKFNFESTLTNISSDTLSALQVEVEELTRHNLLLMDEGLIGEGESFPVPTIGHYTDGLLSPKEFVDIPFTVCLRTNRSFRLFVNVLGSVSNSEDAQTR